jgi:hypothetical protein
MIRSAPGAASRAARSACMLLLLAGTLAACSQAREVGIDEYNDPERRPAPGSRGQGLFGAEGGAIFGTSRRSEGEAASGIGVNAYLWRATLDTVAFMPLSSADPFGGVVLTDWYQHPAVGGERFKVSAFILGQTLRSDGIRVSVFRQVQRGQTWVDAPVAQNTGTELEDRILARARELRIQNTQAAAAR